MSTTSNRLPPHISHSALAQARLASLTPRQLEVLSLIAEGYNNATIARELVLEEKSVENHINAIFGHLKLKRDATGHPRVKAALLYLRESDEDDSPPQSQRRAA